MIVVIADDLSGAAEIANAANAAGLSAEVQIGQFTASTADVICLDSQSRSLAEADAVDVVGRLSQLVARARPDWVYKKCDSVLRGAVAAESLAIARTLSKTRVLLAPANPSRHRLIRHGEYFIENIPLHQTTFAADPEHPRRSSRVLDLVGHHPGLLTPDITSPADLASLAQSLDSDTLPAGGVDFFNAVLKKHITGKSAVPNPQPAAIPPASQSPPPVTLFVCGSNAAWLAGRAGDCAAYAIPVFPLPPEIFASDLPASVIAHWVAPVSVALKKNRTALAALADGQPAPGVTGEILAQRLADAVAAVIAVCPVDRLLLEGGATASAVTRRLGMSRFTVENSPGPGVGALRPVAARGPLLLVKPGSYPWPESVFPPPPASRLSKSDPS